MKNKGSNMKEIIVAIVDQENDTDGKKYPATKIFRYDFDGDENDIIGFIEEHEHILEGGQVFNK